MKATLLTIPDVLLLEPRLFADPRGHFFESYNARSFAEATGQSVEFFQDNQSLSAAGVVRGLHYQLPPSAQAKLVRCLAGEIFDVAVDLRRGSTSFGRWVGVRLSAANRLQLWIPAGFAHGFMALSADTEVFYKASAPYDKAAERAIRWDDPALAIDWPEGLTPLVSDKDAAAPGFADADTFV